LPFVGIEEYKEIVYDFISNSIKHFVTGDLYFNKNTKFYKKYIKENNNVIEKIVTWIKTEPIWTQITSEQKINELSEYIKSLDGYRYDSDRELLNGIFAIKE
jgi:hypothetical protein